MDESVRAAMAKWPDVPGLHGWLSLDESGRWRLKGEPITHAGLIDFINRNYDCDEHGRWFFQNGPQRGYVELAYTPWVLHVAGEGALYTHTHRAVESIEGAWIDEDGHVLLHTEHGIGLVESDTLTVLADWFVDRHGREVAPEALEAAIAALPRDEPGDLWLSYRGGTSPVYTIRRADVAERFGFVATPQTDES